MQTLYDFKLQEDIQMGTDNFDNSDHGNFYTNAEDLATSEYELDDDDTASVFVEPPSRLHSPMPQSPTFSSGNDPAFDDKQQYSQSANLMVLPEGEALNEQGIIDWNRGCTKNSQWQSEQASEIESTVAMLDPKISLTQTSTDLPSHLGHNSKDLLSTDMEP
ncbi:hypothetical protein Clacol_000278 [Clathrus columnatus]|uniref:Uncharacterized protein n=1 Tax=Clathrus columnatus TaxID=1419009 RepID=A0AAV4ZWE3_9AGAM|nr:hypothetical protein Clacol_000278 [Clathrus columnatus]